MHVAAAGWWLAHGPSGANRRLRALLAAAARQLAPGERITLLTNSENVEPAAGVERRVLPVSTRSTLRRVWTEWRALGPTLRQIGASVLDHSSLPVPPGLPCPVSLTIHDVRDLGPFRRRSSAMAEMALRRGVRRAAAVVTPSHFTANRLGDVVRPPLPMTVVPGGVDEHFFSVERSREAPILLHVGHLEPRKNLRMLVEAYARHRRTTKNAPPLYLAGADSGEGTPLRGLVRDRELASHVRFCGAVSEEQLLAYYGRAALVLVPSLEEGFGLPALEGLAAGARVAVSDRGALPEVVGTAATIVPATDTDAWAVAMQRATVEPNDAGREHARSFSWDAAAAKLLAVWRRLSHS